MMFFGPRLGMKFVFDVANVCASQCGPLLLKNNSLVEGMFESFEILTKKYG